MFETIVVMNVDHAVLGTVSDVNGPELCGSVSVLVVAPVGAGVGELLENFAVDDSLGVKWDMLL